MGRARVPARREGVPEPKAAFSSLIREKLWAGERSGSCRTRTRSLPALRQLLRAIFCKTK
jgi:hypothetical protein